MTDPAMDRPIVLASASPRRRELLELLGLPFTVYTVPIDETARPDEGPEVLVARLSATKAAAVARDLLATSQNWSGTPPIASPHSLVIAADTVVVLDQKILGKPQDILDAKAMLLDLRGRAHIVYSGVTVVEVISRRAAIHLSATTVWMRDYSQAEIEAYIATGDALDKAGAYAIQHAGFRPVTRIEGCYTGVMGLPLGALAEGLAHFGVGLPVDIPTVCQSWTGHLCCRQAAS